MQTKELKKVKCIIKKCSSVFKTLPNDKTKACSNFCREEYSRMKGGKKYRKTFNVTDRRLEELKGISGASYKESNDSEFDC